MPKTTVKGKDGKEYDKWKVGIGETYTCLFDQPFQREVKTEKSTFRKYSIKVKTQSGEEVYLNLTGTQAIQLQRSGNLTGKVIKGFEYESKGFGKQVGLKLVK